MIRFGGSRLLVFIPKVLLEFRAIVVRRRLSEHLYCFRLNHIIFKRSLHKVSTYLVGLIQNGTFWLNVNSEVETERSMQK